MYLYVFYKRNLWLLRSIFLCILGFITAVVFALSQIDFESLRNSVITILNDSTQMQVQIDGNISWKFSLRPQIELNEVRIPNAKWAKEKNFFIAKKIDVKLDLISLFNSKPIIKNIKVYDVNINLEKNARGQTSILMKQDIKKEEAPKSDTIAQYPIERMPFYNLEIRNLSAIIYDKKYDISSIGLRNDIRDGNQKYSGWVKYDGSVYPFIVTLSKYDAKQNVYPINIACSTGADALIANVTLNAKTQQLTTFSVTGSIPNIRETGKWLGIDIMDLPKIQLDITGGMKNDKLSFKKSYIAIGESKINFDGYYLFSKKHPYIKATITADSIDIYKQFPDWFGVGKEWIHPDRELNAFQDMPLFGNVLYNKDADIDIKVNRFVVYHSLDLENIDLNIRLKNNFLRVDADTGIATGNIQLALEAMINKSGNYDILAAAHGTKISIGNLLTEIDVNDIISELPVNLDLYVKANGSTMSEVMQTITGPVIVYSVDKGYAHKDIVEYMYGGDFLTIVHHEVKDVFVKNKNDMLEILGVIANLKIRNGLIETQNGVAIETPLVNMRLAGMLDLGKETMELSLVSVPVSGLKLSISGNIVNSLQISGNLSEPDFNINGEAVVNTLGTAVGAGLLLAPFTGGLSIAGGIVAGLFATDLLKNWVADEHPYNTAKEKGAPAKDNDPDWLNENVEHLAMPVLTNR